MSIKNLELVLIIARLVNRPISASDPGQFIIKHCWPIKRNFPFTHDAKHVNIRTVALMSKNFSQDFCSPDKVKRTGGVSIHTHSPLTSAGLPPRKDPGIHCIGGCRGTREVCVVQEQIKISRPLPGFEIQTGSYTDYTTPAHSVPVQSGVMSVDFITQVKCDFVTENKLVQNSVIFQCNVSF